MRDCHAHGHKKAHSHIVVNAVNTGLIIDNFNIPIPNPVVVAQTAGSVAMLIVSKKSKIKSDQKGGRADKALPFLVQR